MLSSVGLGITNFIFTLLGVALIDRLGRRTLMYIGSIGYIVTLTATSLAFAYGQSGIVPAALFLFIGAHAIGQIFAGFMVLQLLFVIFYMPETKGVALEDLQKEMMKA